MRRLITSFFAACLYVFVMTPANAVTVENISNGGFESGDLTGWSCTGADSCLIESFWARTGNFGFVGHDNTDFATLSQTIATTAGTTYDFSVWSHAQALDAGNILRYSLDGGDMNTIASTLAYTMFTDSFVASGTTAAISLFFETEIFKGNWMIDDVSVTNSTVVPLPAALPMFLLALAGLGFMARQRRQA